MNNLLTGDVLIEMDTNRKFMIQEKYDDGLLYLALELDVNRQLIRLIDIEELQLGRYIKLEV